MSGSCLSTNIANAAAVFSDKFPITCSKNMIVVVLLIASSLVFIQRYGKMIRTLLQLLAGKILKSHDHLDAAITMAVELEEEDHLVCVVCQNQVSQCERYKILSACKHGFHVHCIDAWLQRNSTCPLCRCPVPQAPVYYCSISTQDQDFDALISYLVCLLDHIWTWLVNPLTALREECLRFP